MNRCYLWFLSLLLLCACQERERTRSVIFSQDDTSADSVDVYDLPQIEEAGVLIGITLSGPDTYFEYQGQGMGMQYQLAEEFARSIGAKLQMEIAPDTATLQTRLQDGDADFIALEISKDKKWLTRDDTPQLRQAIQEWWNPKRKEELRREASQMHTVKRTMRPMMKDRQKGVISQYDDLFGHYASSIGWDWRLLAAQCYQESGFDPNATSWAGARGLMQLMPGTAEQMGVERSKINDPEINLAAGAKYIRSLQSKFTDIPDPREKICYILAAYNGGVLHIRDAMALAHKNGANQYLWADVAPYILKLQEPRYYRDPVVKRGYMRGSETEGYVRQIMARWDEYRGCAHAYSSGSKPAPAKRNLQGGEYKSPVKSASEFLDSI